MAILNPRQLANFESMWIPEPMSGCYLWIGYTTSDGYGRFNFSGRIVNAHRVAYQQYKGAIPDGLLVLHNCDNPACVNPGHLRLGSDVDNARDRAKRRRSPRKVSNSQVRDILVDQGKYRDIARKYGVSASYISRIKSGDARSYVEV